MKRIMTAVLALVLALVLAGCGGGTGIPAQPPEGNGASQPLKSMKENEYYPSGALMVEYEYDQKGNLLKETRYWEDGTLSEENEYGENGGPLVMHIGYNEDGTPSLRMEPEYDENNNLLKEVYYLGGDTFWLVRVYNGGGTSKGSGEGLSALLEETYYEEDGSVGRHNLYYENGGWKELNRYKDGQLVEKKEFSESGAQVKSKFSEGRLSKQYKYDENDNMVESKYFADDGSVTFYTLGEVDENGRLIKETSHWADGTVASYQTYEYHDDGTYTVTEYTDTGYVSSVSRYDMQGNLLDS